MAVAVSACGLPTETVSPEPFSASQVATPVALAPIGGFADEAGGGIFVGGDKRAVRLRLDGSAGALAPNPVDVDTGDVVTVHGFGPHAALLATAQGLFLAQSGWIIAPPWRDQVKGTPLVGAAVGGGTAWIAHSGAVLRVTEGRLYELVTDDEPLEGTTALAVVQAADGDIVLYLAQGRKLLEVTPRGLGMVPGGFAVGSAALEPDDLDGDIEALVGLSASSKGGAVLFVRAAGQLLRVADGKVTRLDVGDHVDEIAGAGRFLWVRSRARLLLFDADAGKWAEATGVDGVERLLAADASGAAWVDAGGKSYSLTRGPVPRVQGLHQNMRLHEAEIAVRAEVPPGVDKADVVYRIDEGAPIMAKAPTYSLGGEDHEGRPKPFSFAALGPGLHTLKAELKLPDGRASTRAVVFDFRPAAGSVIGFDKDIKPIHEARCAKCHTRGPGPDYSTYDLWKANAPKIVTAVRDRRMPADGPLDPALIQRIERWAAGGSRP